MMALSITTDSGMPLLETKKLGTSKNNMFEATSMKTFHRASLCDDNSGGQHESMPVLPLVVPMPESLGLKPTRAAEFAVPSRAIGFDGYLVFGLSQPSVPTGRHQ